MIITDRDHRDARWVLCSQEGVASLAPQADVLERNVFDLEKITSVDGVGERLN